MTRDEALDAAAHAWAAADELHESELAQAA